MAGSWGSVICVVSLGFALCPPQKTGRRRANLEICKAAVSLVKTTFLDTKLLPAAGHILPFTSPHCLLQAQPVQDCVVQERRCGLGRVLGCPALHRSCCRPSAGPSAGSGMCSRNTQSQTHCRGASPTLRWGTPPHYLPPSVLSSGKLRMQVVWGKKTPFRLIFFFL